MDRRSPAKVRLLAFAAVREVIGSSEAELEVGTPCTTAELWPALLERFPSLAPHRSSLRLAVNGTYAFAGDVVEAGDEVALIPPVAGG